jgi:hypothetical protein
VVNSKYQSLPATILKQGLRLAGICCCVAILSSPATYSRAGEKIDPAKVYQVVYEANLDPVTGQAHASLTLTQPRQLIRSLSFRMSTERYRNIRSTAPLEIQGDQVTWIPGENGGALLFDFVIDHERANGASDARITEDWALLKLDNLFPGATTRSIKGATSQTSLQLAAPKGWAIETPYGRGFDRTLNINNPHRRFDQPRGWILSGKIGVRREKIDGQHLSVASPLGTDFRANDLLAFLRWTLPSLVEIFPDRSKRLLIVSGSEDMWRGGLSGRSSLYMHGDRPLISGNRTSPLLHELFHVASGLRAKSGADWIVEGLAEYYSLTLLFRSGGISEYRYHKSFEKLALWSAGTLCEATDRSRGKNTAVAAGVMRALDNEIRTASNGKASLDTLVQSLAQTNQTITNAGFRSAAKQLTDGTVRALSNCP